MSQLPAVTTKNQSLLGWYAMLKSGGPICRVIRETPKLVLVKYWTSEATSEQSKIYPKDALFFWEGDSSFINH